MDNAKLIENDISDIKSIVDSILKFRCRLEIETEISWLALQGVQE